MGIWIDVEIEMMQGGDEPGCWTLRITGADGNPVSHDDLPMRNPKFKACNWFGIIGADSKQAVFCIDDIHLE
jgi:hypothetical protein